MAQAPPGDDQHRRVTMAAGLPMLPRIPQRGGRTTGGKTHGLACLDAAVDQVDLFGVFPGATKGLVNFIEPNVVVPAHAEADAPGRVSKDVRVNQTLTERAADGDDSLTAPPWKAFPMISMRTTGPTRQCQSPPSRKSRCSAA